MDLKRKLTTLKYDIFGYPSGVEKFNDTLIVRTSQAKHGNIKLDNLEIKNGIVIIADGGERAVFDNAPVKVTLNNVKTGRLLIASDSAAWENKKPASLALSIADSEVSGVLSVGKDIKASELDISNTKADTVDIESRTIGALRLADNRIEILALSAERISDLAVERNRIGTSVTIGSEGRPTQIKKGRHSFAPGSSPNDVRIDAAGDETAIKGLKAALSPRQEGIPIAMLQARRGLVKD